MAGTQISTKSLRQTLVFPPLANADIFNGKVLSSLFNRENFCTSSPALAVPNNCSLPICWAALSPLPMSRRKSTETEP